MPPPLHPTYRRDDLPERRGVHLPLWTLLLGCLLGGLLVYGAAQLLERFREASLTNPAAAERVPEARSGLDGEEAEAVNLFKSTRASVVNVDTVVRVGRNLAVQERQTGTGSGFVWDDEGRVVTNFHVVKDAAAGHGGLRVVLADRSAYEGRIVGVAPESDLAVVQITAPKDKLKKIRVGRSAGLEVGQKVFAIGNPFGLSLSMTKGIISALDREIESATERVISGAIQIDAPINPGNSGGPLLDKDGLLIGVNTAITSPSGGNVGIGFAIPVDTVNPVVTEIIRNGRVAQPDLGLRLVEQYRVRRAGYATGVMVLQVDPNGPAAEAGLRGLVIDPRRGDAEPGDLILSLNGEAAAGNAEFARILARQRVGARVKLKVERGGEAREVEATVRGL